MIDIHSFSVPKSGNSPQENEDRCARLPGSGGWEQALLSISDGATEASFSGEWAEMLVRSTWKSLLKQCSSMRSGNVPEDCVTKWLQPLRAEFKESMSDKSLEWYAREKARQGAFGTFLEVRVTNDRDRRKWAAVSCGDSCVLKVNESLQSSAFPITDPKEFGNRPPLVSSNVDAPVPTMKIRPGEPCERGDRLILVTDAFAAWLLDEKASNTHLETLLNCTTQTEFSALVTTERNEKRLKNDDTTALIYCV